MFDKDSQCYERKHAPRFSAADRFEPKMAESCPHPASPFRDSTSNHTRSIKSLRKFLASHPLCRIHRYADRSHGQNSRMQIRGEGGGGGEARADKLRGRVLPDARSLGRLHSLTTRGSKTKRKAPSGVEAWSSTYAPSENAAARRHVIIPTLSTCGEKLT